MGSYAVKGNLINAENTISDIDDDVTVSVPWCSQRWIIGYLGLVVGTLKNVLQVNISIVIVCMVGSNVASSTTLTSTSSNFTSNVSSILVSVNTTVETSATTDSYNVSKEETQTTFDHMKTNAEFDWDTRTQSTILSAFFYGYMVTMIPFGWSASRYGGKHVLIVAFMLSSVVTLLTPILARTNAYLVIATRVIIGVCLAAISPSWMSVIGRWAMPTERARFVSMYWVGQIIGTTSGLATSGYLCVVGFDNGWASVFYIHGGLCFLVTVVMQWLVYSNPDEHPRITEVERRLLSQTLRGTSEKHNSKVHKTPWCKILTSLPVWAVFLTHFACNWTYYLLLTCLPLFLNDILHFDIKNNGLLSSLPFITQGASLSLTGILADVIASKKWLSLTANRKLFQTVGLIGMGAFIVGNGFVSTDQPAVVIICLCASLFFNAVATSGGYSINIIDIAPKQSAVIYSISNTIGAIPGVIVPILVTTLAQNKTIEGWRHVFYLSAAVALVAGIVYVLFASSELAPWAKDGDQEPEIKVKEPDEISNLVLEDNLESDNIDMVNV